MKILLAEDNVDHAEIIIDTILSRCPDSEIHRAKNGEQVLELLCGPAPASPGDNALPDLILMDIKMPRLNGKDTLKRIKQNPDLQHIPVVMITTSASSCEIEECRQLGAADYLTKPIDPDDYIAKIGSIVA